MTQGLTDQIMFYLIHGINQFRTGVADALFGVKTPFNDELDVFDNGCA